MRGQRLRRRLTAVLLAVLSAGLPLGIAALDAQEPPTRTRAESRHDSGRCSWHHDHAACVQLAQSLAAPAADSSGAVLPRPHARTASGPTHLPPPTPPSTTRHPRAPPTSNL